MILLEKSGIRYPSPLALEVFKKHGAKVDGEIVHIDEKTLMNYVSKAPAKFAMEARNPKYSIEMGGESRHAVPAYGSPYIQDFKGETRYSDLRDFVYFMKQIEAMSDYSINGGIIAQPNEQDASAVTLLMWYTILTGSEKVLFCPAGSEKETRVMMEMASALFGGKESFRKSAKTVYLVDSISPLQMDGRTVDVIRVLSEYRQPFSFTSGVITGVTAPVTPAGAISLGNAEILSGIALSQMIEEGTPAIYGIPMSGADMRSAKAVYGAPEMCLGIRYAARLAKFYNLPSRGPASISDAKYPSQQAAFESMMTMSTCFNEGINFLLHTAGCQDRFNSMSAQKFAVDIELFRRLSYLAKDIDTSPEALATELIMETGHGKDFLTASHTVENFKKVLYLPQIDVRYDQDRDLEAQISRFLKKNIEKYKAPKVDSDVLAEIRRLAVEFGVPESALDSADALIKESFDTI